MDEGKAYVSWEEVVVSNDKGRRVVHYYLKDSRGGADLAVVGRERSVRHMSYAVPNRFLRLLLAAWPCRLGSPSPSFSPPPPEGISLKWRSRREVIDWLSSFVLEPAFDGSSPTLDRFSDDEDAEPLSGPTPKGYSSGKMGHQSKVFSWLGSAWICRKRRKHYRSFCRNGINISVHNFVYIMSEEKKRLVAYVEDLYEDLRANNMVVVRWFHKVDEVGIVLPPDVNEREIFSSLCLQDFSVECIDGLAAVLGAQHFEKFQNETRHSNWEPYLCRRQIDNDDVKPFDITQVQGYWSQEVLRTMFSSSLKLRLKITCGGSSLEGDACAPVSQSGDKRNQQLIAEGIDVAGTSARNMERSRGLGAGSNTERNVSRVVSSPVLLRKEILRHKLQQQLSPGCHAEVLSQDSGIRGCWFRCIIMKRKHDKVKVQYRDVQDADGTGNLEEWVLLSRIAESDQLGIRLCGRPMVRPYPTEGGKVLCSFNVGAIVDAWWHDGWWEGIVVSRESEEQIHVYFPGEQRISIFRQDDLRPSLDWSSNKWNHMKDRKDIASLLFFNIESRSKSEDRSWINELKLQDNDMPPVVDIQKDGAPSEAKNECKPVAEIPLAGKRKAPDLAKDLQLGSLKWKLSKKRKRRRESGGDGFGQNKRHSDTSSGSSQEELEDTNASGGFILLNPLTVDHENCKIGSDPLFSAPMAISNLVMSR
ncbi:uncharacterized protein [Typha angustifolia]|uniref:uncharacterized protein n=1 Tax=Typha angustifolia TaxID=59011 RepID=UPI003C2F0911